MTENNRLAINFSPLKIQDFSFKAYRKEKKQEETKDNFEFLVHHRTLPIELSDDESKKNEYWVIFTPREEFDEFLCNSFTNINVTKDYLTLQLVNRCEELNLQIDIDYFVQKNKIGGGRSESIERIYFINASHNAGKQCVWLKADFLEVSQEFGFYSDFRFRTSRGFNNFKEIQKLSLSLNQYGGQNTDFYSDRYKQLIKFSEKFYIRVFQQTVFDFSKQKLLDNTILATKTFVFANETEGKVANEMKQKGPFQSIFEKVKIYFVLKQDETIYIKSAYEKIHYNLQNIYGISATYESFKIGSITIENVKPLIEKINNEKKIEPNKKILVFLPIQDEGLNYYYQCKYEFDYNNIPIQFARYQTLRTTNSFAFDGLTLQIFTKLGGIPWQMKPTNDDCLIVGLAQANPKNKVNDLLIKRYFGYSVLVNTRGVYKSLEVFSNELEKEDYLENLRQHIVDIIKEYSSSYKKIVIHTPFKIKEDEIGKIQEAILQVNAPDVQFVVIRINTHNDFFGYNKQQNNLTPNESSTIQVAHNKYLVWFEGLKNISENPAKRFSGPTFIEFHYPLELTDEQKYSYLQDIINLSGANWRGFKSKSEPVSIYYCKLVTEFIKEFREIGYDKLDFKNFQPWFL